MIYDEETMVTTGWFEFTCPVCLYEIVVAMRRTDKNAQEAPTMRHGFPNRDEFDCYIHCPACDTTNNRSLKAKSGGPNLIQDVVTERGHKI